MRHHPRPFVVEVKRGTSRQSFQSHSSDADKFFAAEKLLFGTPPAEQVAEVPSSPKPGSTGRVLPVLPDVEEIVLADPVAAPRRGRPPGSKNKVKRPDAPQPAAPLIAEVAISRPDAPVRADPPIAQASRAEAIVPAPALAADPSPGQNEAPARAIRLRDRSRILRRYVLGVEPRAGERRSFRTRKARSAKRER